MSELYWIGRLEAIVIIAWIVFAVSITVLIMGMLGYVVIYGYDDYDIFPKIKKFIKGSIIALIISVPFVVFIPSKKEMYLMWGIGSTIDYIKGNDAAKQLPDKAIQALDKWLDESTEQDKTKGAE